jgi:predicted O-methyltransferase YrrM
MYSRFQLAKKYLRFYRQASNGKGHGIHSPFVFDFVTGVLNDKRNFSFYNKIENLRSQLLHDNTMIEVEDFGAGSTIHKLSQRTISAIAKNSASSAKQGQLLFKIANYYHPNTIIELGTSLGIATAYLASANINANMVTLEGSAAISDIAEKNFQKLGLNNIEIVKGNFDDTLSDVIGKKIESLIDLAYIDGNHRKESTLKYFNMLLARTGDSSVIVFDDIHWSWDMEEAWNEIKSDSRALLTIDLFFIGLVFFRKDFKIKQHFDIRI